MSTAATEKKFTLKSSDGESFEVEEAVAVKSQTIKHMIEDDDDDDCADINGIPLPNVTGKILAKVIEYCKKHHVHEEATKGGEGNGNGNGGSDEELKNWDAAFLKIDQAMLFDLIKAAQYLDIKSLMELTCQNVLDRLIKDKASDQIHKNDFTSEEEERFEGRTNGPLNE